MFQGRRECFCFSFREGGCRRFVCLTVVVNEWTPSARCIDSTGHASMRLYLRRRRSRINTLLPHYHILNSLTHPSQLFSLGYNEHSICTFALRATFRENIKAQAISIPRPWSQLSQPRPLRILCVCLSYDIRRLSPSWCSLPPSLRPRASA